MKQKMERPVYIFAFGEYNSKQVNVSGIKIFRAQLQSLKLRNCVIELYSPNANIYTGFLIALPHQSKTFLPF